jgi:hypothetical protein
MPLPRRGLTSVRIGAALFIIGVLVAGLLLFIPGGIALLIPALAVAFIGFALAALTLVLRAPRAPPTGARSNMRGDDPRVPPVDFPDSKPLPSQAAPQRRCAYCGGAIDAGSTSCARCGAQM